MASQITEGSGATLEIVANWLPFGIGVLLSVVALLAGLHLVVTALRRGRRRSGDRLQRLALVPLVGIVPVATLGFSRPAWHERAVVRLAEIVFGVALLVALLWTARSLRAATRDADPHHAADPSSRPGLLEQHGPVQIVSVVLLVIWTGGAFILHGSSLLGITLH